jgi:hypothetical protein
LTRHCRSARFTEPMALAPDGGQDMGVEDAPVPLQRGGPFGAVCGQQFSATDDEDLERGAGATQAPRSRAARLEASESSACFGRKGPRILVAMGIPDADVVDLLACPLGILNLITVVRLLLR